jgi:hypothetical protein
MPDGSLSCEAGLAPTVSERTTQRRYWLNRKNCWVPEIGLVAAFWPSTKAGAGETVVQIAGETRFVVDYKVNPAGLIRHIRSE